MQQMWRDVTKTKCLGDGWVGEDHGNVCSALHGVNDGDAVRATRGRTWVRARHVKCFCSSVGGHGCMGALRRTVSFLVQSVGAHTSTFLGYETEP